MGIYQRGFTKPKERFVPGKKFSLYCGKCEQNHIREPIPCAVPQIDTDPSATPGGYFYADNGIDVILIHQNTPGCPRVQKNLQAPDVIEMGKVKALEADLPKSPSGESYRLTNGPRCPHCGELYTDFNTPPEVVPSNRWIENFALKHVDHELKTFGKPMSLHPALVKVLGPY